MPRRPTIFLARETYRRRRLIDALRVLPVLGALLFLAPLLGPAGQLRLTSLAGIYLFVVWLLLIIGSALLVRSLSRTPEGLGPDPLESAPGDDEA